MEQCRLCDPIYVNTHETNFYVHVNVFKWWARKVWLEQSH